MIDAILSSLKKSTTSDFIYSSLSFFATRRGGRLPGSWFVEALGSLGIEEQAVRQTLFRLERTGVLRSEKEGRVKWYRAARVTESVLAVGRNRVAVATDVGWDGQWTLVHFRVGEEDRDGRDRIRDLLRVEGFGSLGPGLYLHPRDRTAHIESGAKELGLSNRLHIFRGAHVAGPEVALLVNDLWDLAAIAARYRKFVRRYARIAEQPASRWTPQEAFAVRFAFMFEYFRITWDDPALPAELLPEEWPAEAARVVANTLTQTLMTGAVAFGDDVLNRTSTGGRK